MKSVKETILDFVLAEYLDGEEAISATTPLISSGIVDSFSMVSLKRFLENRYRVTIPSSMATPQAFDTAESIEKLLLELGVEA
jgi:acyl carrier protein